MSNPGVQYPANIIIDCGMPMVTLVRMLPANQRSELFLDDVLDSLVDCVAVPTTAETDVMTAVSNMREALAYTLGVDDPYSDQVNYCCTQMYNLGVEVLHRLRALGAYVYGNMPYRYTGRVDNQCIIVTRWANV